MVNVVFVQYPSNKSTTWHFSSLKKAIKFLKFLKEENVSGYYCLNFEL